MFQGCLRVSAQLVPGRCVERAPNPASVRVLEKVGMRLVDSYVDEDGQRDIYRR